MSPMMKPITSSTMAMIKKIFAIFALLCAPAMSPAFALFPAITAKMIAMTPGIQPTHEQMPMIVTMIEGTR